MNPFAVFCRFWVSYRVLTVSPVSVVLQDCPTTIATVFDSRAPLVMGVFVGTGVLLVSKCVACCTFLYLGEKYKKTLSKLMFLLK